MGSPPGERERYDNEHQKPVSLSRGFWMGKFEVTQDQYEKVMGQNPSFFKDKPNNPVEQVSWPDAVWFCKRFTEQERRAGRLPAGWEYRLPTEAQWEYACRAGTTTATAFGNSLSSRQANFDGKYPYNGAEKGPYLERTEAVGRYPANAWSLHDMHDNVWEWCRDGYRDKLPGGADPFVAPEGAASRVLRGGSWGSHGRGCRSAVRGGSTPEGRDRSGGFRVAAVQSEQTEPGPAGNAPKTITSPTTGIQLVRIEPGAFEMGSPDSDKDAEADEKPRHRVQISRRFYLGATEVTVGQFRRFVEATNYRTEPERDGLGGLGWDEHTQKVGGRNPRYSWRFTGWEQSDEHPVVNVTWNDAVAFCDWLSRQEGQTYRLPTEAEWEYACRAGTTTRYVSGDGPEGLDAYAWSADNSGRDRWDSGKFWDLVKKDWSRYDQELVRHRCRPHPVAQKRANAWGLFDMHGSAWEWCSDAYDADSYKRPQPVDPPGASEGSGRVLRGGSWVNDPRYCRSADRDGIPPGHRSTSLSFRVVRVQFGR
jgi:formylglycine-generating enzyme required for sulfatase activity